MVRVELAGLVHRLQHLAAQEDHLRPQSAARSDPAPHRHRIHRIKHHGCLAIGESVTVSAEIPGGVTRQEFLPHLQINVEQWKSGLSEVANRSQDLPPEHLTRSDLHPSALDMLQAAKALCAENVLPRISEAVLLHSALGHLTPSAREQFEDVRIDLENERGWLKKFITPILPIEVFEEELLKRLSGRWICRNCQTPYHELTSPPKTLGKCDKCGGELYQRSDDIEETIRERLKIYFAQTTPVIDYYKIRGKLVTVDGKLEIEEVAEEIINVLEPKAAETK